MICSLFHYSDSQCHTFLLLKEHAKNNRALQFLILASSSTTGLKGLFKYFRHFFHSTIRSNTLRFKIMKKRLNLKMTEASEKWFDFNIQVSIDFKSPAFRLNDLQFPSCASKISSWTWVKFFFNRYITSMIVQRT